MIPDKIPNKRGFLSGGGASGGGGGDGGGGGFGKWLGGFSFFWLSCLNTLYG